MQKINKPYNPNRLPAGRNPYKKSVSRQEVDYLSDLRENFMDELKRISPSHESGLTASPTDAEIIEGAVVIDARNLHARGTVYSMCRKKYIVQFGEKMDGVQYWTLTAEGLEAVRRNRSVSE